MRLKRKVAKKVKREKRLVLSRRELASIFESRVSKLQGARIGAEGLMNVLSFVGEENAELESTHDTLLMGLSEVALLLYKCLRRETDAMERAVWACGEVHEAGLCLMAGRKVEAILAARHPNKEAPGDPSKAS